MREERRDTEDPVNTLSRPCERNWKRRERWFTDRSSGLFSFFISHIIVLKPMVGEKKENVYTAMSLTREENPGGS